MPLKVKLISFDYKAWILAASEGYVLLFDIFQVNLQVKNHHNLKILVLGGSRVLKLLRVTEKIWLFIHFL